MITGLVVKTYNGYYYVAAPLKQNNEAKAGGGNAPAEGDPKAQANSAEPQTSNAEAHNNEAEIYTCKVKGKMKLNRFSLCTGDRVELEPVATVNPDLREGMITRVLPRSNVMLRPTIANLDLLVVTMALANPDFSYLILDKLLVLAEEARIPVAIVLNKADMAPANLTEQIISTYEPLGYPVYPISALKGQGIEPLHSCLEGKVTAFGGPSGVGKSSTLNALQPGIVRETGQVSEKIGRGKHTTRFAHLVPFAGGYLADTPGFGNVNITELRAEDLPGYFREFAAFDGDCKYHPCSHTHEPICGVKAAVEQGKIAPSRYESYLTILKEIKEEKERNYRK